MSNLKEKEIILYEISDNSDCKVCLKIPAEPLITTRKPKPDTIKSWELYN
jgi:hypothetical protein